MLELQPDCKNPNYLLFFCSRVKLFFTKTTKNVFYSVLSTPFWLRSQSAVTTNHRLLPPQQRTIHPNPSSPSSVSLPVDSAVPWVMAASLGAIQCVSSLWEVDGRGSWRRTSSSSDRYRSISLPHTFLSLI